LKPEQQAIRVKKAHSEVEEPMGQIVRFYVPFLAKGLGVFVSLGKGVFRAQTENVNGGAKGSHMAPA
jgi:hypothetical protein